MGQKNKDVTTYLSGVSQWQKEMKMLREIVLDCGLQEEFKWKQPCYTYLKKNVVLMSTLKNYCTLSFLKGTLLKDPKKILISPGENSQATKQIRFTSIQDIKDLDQDIRSYLEAAKKLEDEGKKVQFKKKVEEQPEELTEALQKSAKLNKAFQKLTPGRQRGYILFISAAKSSEARHRRIEKYRQRIFDGKGINDCVCGLSKKMPGCDGSHRDLKN